MVIYAYHFEAVQTVLKHRSYTQLIHVPLTESRFPLSYNLFRTTNHSTYTKYLSILVALFFINNMYVNPQLANYIHTRSLSASICRIWPDFRLHWWSSSCEHIYFKLRQFVLTIIREIVQALHILHINLAI